MDAVSSPAGWYRDPAARHEQRYWDGLGWTSHIIDAGVPGEDAPAGGVAVPFAAYAANRAGFRARAGGRGRHALIATAANLLGLAFVFEMIVSVIAFNTFHGPGLTSDVGLWVTCWMYGSGPNGFVNGHYVTQSSFIGYPPLLLWPTLFAAAWLLQRATLPSVIALKSAGMPFPRPWASSEHKRAWADRLWRLQSARLSLFRTSERVYLVLGGIASLAVALISATSILGRSGFILNQGGSPTPTINQLSLGLGPWLCLAAGMVGFLAALLAWPYRRDRDVVVHPDGSVDLL